MHILSIGTSLFEVLPLCSRKSHYLKIVRFFHSFVDSCIWTICHHKDFTGRVLLWENFISSRNNLFHTQRRFFLARYRSPNEPHLLRMVQPIRSPENPGTTVVSVGHLTPWPENPGYRTQVWDNCINPAVAVPCGCGWCKFISIMSADDLLDSDPGSSAGSLDNPVLQYLSVIIFNEQTWLCQDVWVLPKSLPQWVWGPQC